MSNKDELFERVLLETVEYKAAVARAKIIAKQEVASRVDALTSDARIALSQAMHEAHAGGLAKDRIRVATGFYNNAASFNPVWDAFVPETATDLRATTKTLEGRVSGVPVKQYRWDGTDLLLNLDDDVIVITDARMEKDEEADEEWVEFTPPEGYDDQYSEINDLVTEALADQEFAGADADADADAEATE